ncbi:hypothetical protein [Liquorilactobacillus mali]|nr:hypothetical protein [Liquorilactobacillus mali]EJF00676.1 hypothetical protein LMA_02989 [Liquorilactobacillus mali KCTC 3596 = DSM 20444]MDC7954087.1 hypothetical protein [Liquorilactobacillus mali]QFQ75736.1 hypothetical protein LM596_11890 [Liquorilactobacillus mali]
MEFKEQGPRKNILFVFISGSMFIIQSFIILFFNTQLGTKLPTYFTLNGFVIYWFNYSHPIVVPGILLLGVIHFGGLILVRYIPLLLKSVPFAWKFLKNVSYIGYILFSWIEFLSWTILIYFFLYDSQTMYLMLTINIVHLLLLIVGTIYYRKKS